MIPTIMTMEEVAEALKVDESTVIAMAEAGELPSFRVRDQWRIRRADLESWVADQVLATKRDIDQPPASGGTLVRPIRGARLSSKNLNNPKEATMSDEHLTDLTERVSQDELHKRFVDALGPARVSAHVSFQSKPFEVDLVAPLPQRVRVYMFNATRPPGGRPLGEHKVQIMVPGQGRQDRGSFDSGGGRIVLLVGYAAEENVFILWDAGLYPDFAWSRNVQVKGHTIIDATAGKIATQERQLRPASGRSIVETVLAANSRNLAEAIQRRMELTRQRLLRD